MRCDVGSWPSPVGDLHSGEFREDAAHSVALDLLSQPDRPMARHVANGLMALGVMRAVADLGRRGPGDISIASTDTIAGIGGLPSAAYADRASRVDMTNEAERMLVDRIGKAILPPRNAIFQPALVVGDSCAPFRS